MRKNPHVRICGGPGSATTLVYPTIVSAAVVLEMDGAVCRAARIVLGGVAPVPWRVPDAERILVGQRVTPALAARAAEVAVAGARPLSKNGYKVALTAAVVERTLVELASRG